MNIAVRCCGTATFRREDLDRGLEPDNCYYIGHEALVRGKKRLDLTQDPPPDLALEVDITSSSLDRQGIYGALRVPEIWLFDGESLRVYVLNAEGEYEIRDQSPTFPELPLAKIVELLRESDTTDETTLFRSFQAWIREYILGRRPLQPPPEPRE